MIDIGAPVPEVDVFDGKGSAPLPVFFSGPTLLVFFRSDCRRCEGALGLAAGIGRVARSLTVIGVSQETIEDTAEFLGQINVRLPVVIDDRPFPASRAFEIDTVPSFVLIEDDRVSWTSDGFSSDDVEELAGLLVPWTRDTQIGMHPDYIDAAGSESKGRPTES